MKRLQSVFRLAVLSSMVLVFTACSDGPMGSSGVDLHDDDQTILSERSIRGRMLGLIGTKKLALTFDDGPDNEVTLSILQTLRREKVKATFFVVGAHALERTRGVDQRRVLERVVAEGHILANHTQTHVHLAPRKARQEVPPEYNMTIRPERLLEEVMFTHQIIVPLKNPRHRLYFRAPFGAWRSGNAHYLNAHPELRDYIGPINWDVGGATEFDDQGLIRKAADWQCWGARLTVETCAQGYLNEIEAKQGGVVLLHDRHPNRSRRILSQTPEMIRRLIPELKRRGYSFVTLDDIRALDQYQ